MAISLGVLSTYPPTQCGIATFAESLVTHLAGQGADVGVISIVDVPQESRQPVRHEYVRTAPGAAAAAAAALNVHDVALVQHEYGIYGGLDGEDVLDVLDLVTVPIIVVLHTVLTSQTDHQHEVLARVVSAATSIVTMTETARGRLIAGWDVDPRLVTVIAHGAVDNRSTPAPRRHGDRPVILTWGLLGEGKGIEWALEAMAGLADLRPRPLYRVVGQTHPKVLAREGEAYRDRLTEIVTWLGIASMVEFDARYLDGPALRAIVRSSDIVVLPYDSRDQVTSGVLTEAVVAGKPVVSTSFPHAVELLSSGAGILVPQRDPLAIGAALRRIIGQPKVAAELAANARDLAPSLLWPAVAAQYVALARSLRSSRDRSAA